MFIGQIVGKRPACSAQVYAESGGGRSKQKTANVPGASVASVGDATAAVAFEPGVVLGMLLEALLGDDVAVSDKGVTLVPWSSCAVGARVRFKLGVLLCTRLLLGFAEDLVEGVVGTALDGSIAETPGTCAWNCSGLLLVAALIGEPKRWEGARGRPEPAGSAGMPRRVPEGMLSAVSAGEP